MNREMSAKRAAGTLKKSNLKLTGGINANVEMGGGFRCDLHNSAAMRRDNVLE
jgi:hypothetical protein